MAANPISFPQQMTTIICGKEGCDVTFAIPQSLYDELRRTHGDWFCPRGHCRRFVGQSEEEKLRAALAKKEFQLKNANDAADRARDERWKEHAKRERLQSRVKKGRCPASRLCKGRFENLQQHLKDHHPHHPWRTK